ncbi:hypothetical protein [Thermoleptolyngbya sp.]
MRSKFETLEKFELNRFATEVEQTAGSGLVLRLRGFWRKLTLGLALMAGGLAWAGLGAIAAASELPESELSQTYLSKYRSEYRLDTPANTISLTTLDQLSEYSGENRGDGNMAQVTSVTEFSDVSPSDWAYEALAYLANSESQGGLDCLEGYPNGLVD